MQMTSLLNFLNLNQQSLSSTNNNNKQKYDNCFLTTELLVALVVVVPHIDKPSFSKYPIRVSFYHEWFHGVTEIESFFLTDNRQQR
jgi:hypothetical protein